MRVVIAYGTRPERIKLKPVHEALHRKGVEVVEWCSGQSRDLLKDVEGVKKIGWWDQGLTEGISMAMSIFTDSLLIRKGIEPPDCVIVQGDTATAFACAQAAFLARVPVAHVEAGMRTYEDEPFPEDAFRRQICAISTWDFCPDITAAENCAIESGLDFNEMADEWCGEHASIHIVGNTVIDTLPSTPFRVLVTLHRRENWGARRQSALKVLADFDHAHDNLVVEIIKHPNGTADYAAIEADHLLDGPFSHSVFLEMVQEADVVVTDSGGLQEEAAHFGKPCLVLRTSTERVALLQSGAVQLVNPDAPQELRDELEAILGRRRAYGDGKAGERIAEILVQELSSRRGCLDMESAGE